MPDEVVADSTVLIFLGKIDRLDWLDNVFDQVLIPPEIQEEVVTRGHSVGAKDAVLVEAAIADGWITVCESEINPAIARFDLEAGETAVLSLALHTDHSHVLADEESVREVARLNELNPRGTLWFLFDAIRRDKLTFSDFLEEFESLLDAGFYLDQQVYLEAIQRARRLDQAEK